MLLASTQLLQAQTVASNALDFDGADDYVQLPEAHYFTQNDFTIEHGSIPGHLTFGDFSNGEASDNVLMALTDATSGLPAGSSLTDENTLRRDADIDIVIESLSETNLILRFHWDKDTYSLGGRTASVAGEHAFEFRRE